MEKTIQKIKRLKKSLKMNNLIKEIAILTEKTNIFNDNNTKYVIPLYQRAFAWEDKEILQLIEDINDFEEDYYYIGSLIVSKAARDNYYEVIDGQQRLTALFLLFNSLNIKINNCLSFSCRKKSDFTLKHINNIELLKDSERETSLIAGKEAIDAIINHKDFDEERELFIRQLKKVKIYRIEVPDKTDLNRYFEIMNTRGEQLEQHDILKATLMEAIVNENKKMQFAKIWNACSDMTGYVQMKFKPDDRFKPGDRTEIFGNNWDDLQLQNIKKITKKIHNKKFIIKNIIKPNFKVDKTEEITDKDERVRFESIITFPHFLLHVLKIHAADKKIHHEKREQTLIPELLDDKKLLSTFNNVIKNGIIKGAKISRSKETFSFDFVICLLNCRFLFDKYIIKREFVNESTDGRWSLKSLKASSKKPSYTNTLFKRDKEHYNTAKNRNYYNLMLQSCLRVSYTSPKSMHWITDLLKWLYLNKGKNHDKLSEYENETESIIKNAVNKDYLERIENDNYDRGTDTPHIVFNFLDYLLWKENQNKYKDFVFEFRNSIEHWYPRNPSEGTFEQWSKKDGVDNFGNLCIIQRSINSKFSNLSPEAKKSTFYEMISKASLKLRIMNEITIPSSSGKAPNKHWKDTVCQRHQEKMLKILINACECE